ncbi:MAG: hypothetical protein F4Y03_05710 [Alphaproteobacteria bacterium]|nr:hypothetical protein [Alphaproteobacteria bacterium]
MFERRRNLLRRRAVPDRSSTRRIFPDEALAQRVGAAPREGVAPVPPGVDAEPTTATFTFVAHDEGGLMTWLPGTYRLVCVADTGEKVVVFGSEPHLGNVLAVLEAGLPCFVQCETHPAPPAANYAYGHTHWVLQDGALEIGQRPPVQTAPEPHPAPDRATNPSRHGCGHSVGQPVRQQAGRRRRGIARVGAKTACIEPGN